MSYSRWAWYEIRKGNAVVIEGKAGRWNGRWETEGERKNGREGEREGGRSAEQRWRGKGEPDGHQMNKLWRAPFCRMGSPSPLRPTLPSPPLLPLFSSLSLTVQFPPLASLLLPANCEWSLIIGPPIRPRPKVSRRLREETGMSKCYPRQQTARETEVTHNKAGRSSGCTGTGEPPLTGRTHRKTKEVLQFDFWTEKMVNEIRVWILFFFIFC